MYILHKHIYNLYVNEKPNSLVLSSPILFHIILYVSMWSIRILFYIFNLYTNEKSNLLTSSTYPLHYSINISISHILCSHICDHVYTYMYTTWLEPLKHACAFTAIFTDFVLRSSWGTINPSGQGLEQHTHIITKPGVKPRSLKRILLCP